jgi:hypothetical protein
VRTVSKTRSFKTDPITAFDVLDDLSVTGMHMTESSMPMMGGKMEVNFLSSNRTGLHTRYRWTGKVMWLHLDFTVEVSEWKRGISKTWQTIGPAKLIIYSWFRMKMEIHQITDSSLVTLAISYLKPNNLVGRFLCYLVGDWYCKWCIDNMLADAATRIAAENVRNRSSMFK